jgi:hypothetical protein
MPARRPTAAELDERLELTYRLLAAGARKSAVKRALRQRFGPLHHTTAERYLRRARERMLIELREDRESHRAAAYGFYRSVIADPRASIRDRLAAARIDKLLGLEIKFPASPLALLEALGLDPDDVLALAASHAPKDEPCPAP